MSEPSTAASTTDAASLVHAIRSSLLGVARPVDAEPMAAYMRGCFPFLGVKTPARRRSTRSIVRPLRSEPVDTVLAVVDELWGESEREFHQVGADLLADTAPRLGVDELPTIRRCLTTNAWWDTVDAIAIGTVGTMARSSPAVVAVMDDWIELDDDTSDSTTSEMWLARTAILHQLKWKDDTDEERLFRHSLRRAGDTQFFLRKAIGWALRQYARTAPGAVRAFVDEHRAELSALTVREATKHL
ncbi:MAG: DNA alkylation repair protein [Actinomycetota bacterium]